jgi:hypothetical protein
MGAGIVALVLLFPQGIAGLFAGRAFRRAAADS